MAGCPSFLASARITSPRSTSTWLRQLVLRLLLLSEASAGARCVLSMQSGSPQRCSHSRSSCGSGGDLIVRC